MKYILIAFICFSCNISMHKKFPKISTEALDTIKSVPGKIIAQPVLLETAFIKGTTQKIDGKTLNLYGITIGKIKIVSGHIIACDPGHIDEYGIPFTQVFPTGEFPVQLSIAKFGDGETIAFARINFSDEPVEKWEFALQKGQPPIPVGGKKIHGYSVDLGVGIFADEEACKALDKSHLTQLDAGLYKEMDKHYHNDGRYTMYTFGAHNLAAFSSGAGDGDGVYATYIGFDAKDRPCRLVTDFNLFDWKKK
ncbi:MAG: hypothetical protein JWN76_2309 [Chitinophagaceae bacterium]|nr:hypothetical protein [Chitinophagaceae bacterium]